MKAGTALHFNADYPEFGGYYGPPIYREVLSTLLKLDVRGKVMLRVGDVPFRQMKQNAIANWWKPIDTETAQLYCDVLFLQEHNIFAIMLEPFAHENTTRLDQHLRGHEAYLGSIQIDPQSTTHLFLYKELLIPFGEYEDRAFYLFYDKFSGDRDQGMLEYLREIPFEKVAFRAKSSL